MTHKKYCSALVGAYIFHLADAFHLEFKVANRQNFIHNKDLGFEMCCHRKSQSHHHSRGITLYRCVEEFCNTAEIYDLIHLGLDFSFRHPQDSAVQKNVFTAREIRMETGTYFQQGSYS